VRKAVTLGIPPPDAVTMATLSAARYHRLLDRGAVAPGLLADVIAVRDLAEFRPVRVWKRGRLVATDGRAVDVPAAPLPDWMRDTVRVAVPFEHDRLRVAAQGPIRVIGVQPGQIVTRALIDDPTIVDGEAVADASRDLAKIAVIERHRGTGRTGVGFVRGFGIRRGALASTHAHDAHNVVVVGIDDDDMAAAVEELARIGGGQVAVREGRAIGALACPYAGLLSEEPAEVVAAQAAALATAARELGVTIPSPFMAMSFLALSVVPELKITDRGLVDTIGFEVVPLAAPHTAPTEAGRAS
jgi:adenine deaminase